MIDCGGSANLSIYSQPKALYVKGMAPILMLRIHDCHSEPTFDGLELCPVVRRLELLRGRLGAASGGLRCHVVFCSGVH